MMQRRNKLLSHHSSTVGKCRSPIMAGPSARDAHWPQKVPNDSCGTRIHVHCDITPIFSLPSQEKVKINTRCCFSASMVRRRREMVTTWFITSHGIQALIKEDFILPCYTKVSLILVKIQDTEPSNTKYKLIWEKLLGKRFSQTLWSTSRSPKVFGFLLQNKAKSKLCWFQTAKALLSWKLIFKLALLCKIHILFGQHLLEVCNMIFYILSNTSQDL